MYDRNSPQLRAEVKAMLDCPEWAEYIAKGGKAALSGDTYDQHGEVSDILSRHPEGEKFNRFKDSYGFVFWECRLPSGLVVKGSGISADASWGRD